MALTLLEVKNWLKSSRGLTRDKEDGLLDDTILLEVIHNALKRVAKDCELLPTTSKFALVAGQWQYPIPEEVVAIRDLWREDTNGTKQPLGTMTQEQFHSGHDPDDSTSLNPTHYVYPIYAGRRFQFYAKAPDNFDFLPGSRITGASRRTVIDSGANFGRTLSGARISPGDVVHNLSADSFGYVETLDVITAKTSGVCTAGTDSSHITIAGYDWEALGVKVDDIICTPQTGIPTSYAFVTEMDGADLYYDDIRGALSAFDAAMGVKVGIARRIRLSTAAPHRGLRSGTYNYFTIAATASATMTGTTFTPTACTGSSPSGASVGEEAIASGGSHGYIEEVGDSSITVTCWIGGVPVDGEVVTIRACDEYAVETCPRIQPFLWLYPTPSTSDTPGTERLWIEHDIQPYLPTRDHEFLDIPERYTDCFYSCVEWHAARQTGTHNPRAVAEYKQLYEDELLKFQGDIHEVPRGEIITPWSNRHPGSHGSANQGVVSGNVYDVDGMLEDQNA